MARTKEQYKNDTQWRLGPQQSFWDELKRSAEGVWLELDGIAQRWAKAAPGSDIKGTKIFYYTDGHRTKRCNNDAFASETPSPSAYVHGGWFSNEVYTEIRSWQSRHGLDTGWLSTLADLHVLQRYTDTRLIKVFVHAVSDDPEPIPSGEIGDTPEAYAKRAKAHYKSVIAPHYGLTQMRPTPQPHHLEWLVLYQCVTEMTEMSYADIADVYAKKLGGKAVDSRSVEGAVKDAADVIQLPLRKQRRGRKRAA